MRNPLYKTMLITALMATNVCVSAETGSTSIPQEQSTTIKIFDPKTFVIDARADQDESIKDPLQGLNRKIYVFNDAIDRNMLRPLAVIYSETMPVPAQGAYSNFRNNLKEPWSAVNQLLQGKPTTSLKTLGRFTLNTLTSLGFADVAKRVDLPNVKDGFGTTLGVWGMPSGPYLVLPFFGSSSLRDAVGSVPDSFARPQSYFIDPDELVWANTALEVTALRAQYLPMDSVIQGDKYAAMRDVYLQQRAFEIAEKRGEDISQSMFAEDPLDTEILDEEIEEEDVLEENMDSEP